MNPDIGRAGLLIGCFILVAGIPLLWIMEPGSAEFYVTLFSVLAGVTLIVLLGIAIRISRR